MLYGQNNQMKLQLRKAQMTDEAWLWQLYLTNLRRYVESTWGWDDEIQEKGFKESLGITNFMIVLEGISRVAAFCAKEQSECLWLHMLLVEPSCQRRGVGRYSMEYLQSRSNTLKLPLRFSVMKVNPVMQFYKTLGYSEYKQDEHCVYFQKMPTEI